MSESEHIPCDSCNGAGKSYCHLNYGPYRPHEWKWVTCDRCSGTGQITTEQHERIEAGQRLRERRKSLFRTLRDQAKRLGLSPSELSQAEQGRSSLERIREIETLTEDRA